MKPLISTLMILLLAGCAASPRLTETSVTHIPREELELSTTPVPESGYLSTSQPNEQVLDRVAGAGYRVVIDFRGVDEDRGMDERSEVEARGMRYISLPIASTDEATWENAQTLADILASTEGPILMHCYSGNRAGSMLALAARLEGASPDAALAFGKRGGLTRWEEDIAEILENDEP